MSCDGGAGGGAGGGGGGGDGGYILIQIHREHQINLDVLIFLRDLFKW